MVRTLASTAAAVVVIALSAGCSADNRADTTPSGVAQHQPGTHHTTAAASRNGACHVLDTSDVTAVTGGTVRGPVPDPLTPDNNRCDWRVRLENGHRVDLAVLLTHVTNQHPTGRRVSLAGTHAHGRYLAHDQSLSLPLRHHTTLVLQITHPRAYPRAKTTLTALAEAARR